jgi:pSer/pThr/pTyr-binding forkhead associated (FHA) protein
VVTRTCPSCGTVEPELLDDQCAQCGAVIGARPSSDKAPSSIIIDIELPEELKRADNPPDDSAPLELDTGPVLAGARVSLALTLGRRLVREYKVDQAVVSIGRGACDVVIDNPSVSRHHCRLLHGRIGELLAHQRERPTGASLEALAQTTAAKTNEEVFVVQDMKTANGTAVNGRPVEAAVLRAGDTIGLGKYVLIFRPTAEQLDALELVPAREAPGRPGPAVETTYLRKDELERVRRQAVDELTAHLKRVDSAGGVSGRYPLKARTVLGGGDEADVPLKGRGIAPAHAVINLGPAGARIEKISGLRRLRVNETAVKKSELRDGDRLRIGDNAFLYFDAVSRSSGEG